MLRVEDSSDGDHNHRFLTDSPSSFRPAFSITNKSKRTPDSDQFIFCYFLCQYVHDTWPKIRWHNYKVNCWPPPGDTCSGRKPCTRALCLVLTNYNCHKTQTTKSASGLDQNHLSSPSCLSSYHFPFQCWELTVKQWSLYSAHFLVTLTETPRVQVLCSAAGSWTKILNPDAQESEPSNLTPDLGVAMKSTPTHHLSPLPTLQLEESPTLSRSGVLEHKLHMKVRTTFNCWQIVFTTQTLTQAKASSHSIKTTVCVPSSFPWIEPSRLSPKLHKTTFLVVQALGCGVMRKYLRFLVWAWHGPLEKGQPLNIRLLPRHDSMSVWVMSRPWY